MVKIFSTFLSLALLTSTLTAQSVFNLKGVDKQVLSTEVASPGLFQINQKVEPISPVLKQEQVDKYFGYANQAAENLQLLGTGKAGNVGSMILLPVMPGNIIKGIRFYTGVVSAESTIFVATSNPKDNKARPTVRKVKVFKAEKGWNTVAFDEPYTCPEDEVVLIGYQVMEGSEKDEHGPIAFDGDKVYVHDLNYAILDADLLSEGDDLQKFGSLGTGWGNAMIFADIEDKANKITEYAEMTHARLTNASETGEIPAAQPIAVTAYISNPGAKPVTKLEGVIKLGATREAPEIPFSQAVNIPARSKMAIDLPAVGKSVEKGLGSAIIFLLKFNNVEVTETLTPTQAKIMGYKVPTENGAIARNSILFERYTTEKCPNCPRVEEPMEEMIAAFETNAQLSHIKPSVIAHHAGFYKDFLTLEESEQLVPRSFVGGGAFAPALMINRVAGSDGALAHSFRMEDLEGTINKVLNSEQAARFDEIVPKWSGNKLQLEIKGWAGTVMRDQLAVSVVITENNVEPRNQAGASYYKKGPFMHQYVARQFLTPWNGKLVTFGADDTFTVKTDAVEIDTEDWKKEDLKVVVFVHQNMEWPLMDQRQVYASTTLDYLTNITKATLDILPEDMPVVSVYNGYLTVKGAAERIEVYDMAGRLVSTSIAKQLEAGVYIVKVVNAHGNFTSKVVVR